MSKSEFKIGYYAGSWPQNIGNAFFDFGAEAILRNIFPNAQHFRTGGAVHWMFNRSGISRRGPVRRKIYSYFPMKYPQNQNSLEIAQIAELDLIVFAGMSMCEEFVKNNGKTIIEASQNGAAVLGLGTGGSLYTKKEAKSFADFFNRLERAAIVTRDSETFDSYKGKIKNLYSGIDSAFYLPEYFRPPNLYKSDFKVLTFDNTEIPKELYKTNQQIIHAHHDLWGPLKKRYINKPRTLVSDVPEDYLSLYANASETHSDRVHACIATLAYGNKAKLYSNTKRKALFSEFGLSNITSELVRIEPQHLDSKKLANLETVKSALRAISND